MMKIIIFLGVLALSQCQQYAYPIYEDQQPNAYIYHPQQLESANRERRYAYYPNEEQQEIGEARQRRYINDGVDGHEISVYYPSDLQEIEIQEARQKRSVYYPNEQQEIEEPRQRRYISGGVLHYYPDEIEEIESLERQRRSLQPGAPTFPLPNQEPPTKVTPHVTHQDGTTNIGAKVDHKFGNHDASAYWNKNVRGPGKSKPNYGVRGTFRF